MSRPDFKRRLRWVLLNAVLYLSVAGLAYSYEGWRAALPFVLLFVLGAGWVLFRPATQSHP